MKYLNGLMSAVLLTLAAPVLASPVLHMYTTALQVIDHLDVQSTPVLLELNNANETVAKWKGQADKTYGAHLTFECSFTTTGLTDIRVRLEGKSPGKGWKPLGDKLYTRKPCRARLNGNPVIEVTGVQVAYKARSTGTQKIRVKAWTVAAGPGELATAGYLSLLVTD